MKKPLLIIMTVAILGALGLYINPGHNTSAKLVSSPVSATGSSNQSNSSTAGSSAPQTTAASSTTYKDGTYTGSAADTPYGVVQIAVVVSGGKITDVNFLQMPSDLAHSQEVTTVAEPLLKQTTLQAQSANIEFVSGATSTSNGYEQSLQAALDQAAQA
ncbi:MAG: FMN-binding protein [Candidatus Saccharimonadales bacterium]|jgi:uncharacterized protein with FMN-binding domain